jgi:hypothetical protein
MLRKGVQGHERWENGWLQVGRPECGIFLQCEGVCANARAAARSFKATFERRREESAWLEATRKALFGGISIFSYTQRLKKFRAARRGAAMILRSIFDVYRFLSAWISITDEGSAQV